MSTQTNNYSILPPTSDGRSSHIPPNLVSKDPLQPNYYQPIEETDARHVLWRKKLAQSVLESGIDVKVEFKGGLKKLSEIKAKDSEFILKVFPSDYVLYSHIWMTKSMLEKRKSGVRVECRTDTYLYGYGTKRFRSANEFIEHILFLYRKEIDPKAECDCCYCSPGKIQRQIGVVRPTAEAVNENRWDEFLPNEPKDLLRIDEVCWMKVRWIVLKGDPNPALSYPLIHTSKQKVYLTLKSNEIDTQTLNTTIDYWPCKIISILSDGTFTCKLFELNETQTNELIPYYSYHSTQHQNIRHSLPNIYNKYIESLRQSTLFYSRFSVTESILYYRVEVLYYSDIICVTLDNSVYLFKILQIHTDTLEGLLIKQRNNSFVSRPYTIQIQNIQNRYYFNKYKILPEALEDIHKIRGDVSNVNGAFNAVTFDPNPVNNELPLSFKLISEDSKMQIVVTGTLLATDDKLKQIISRLPKTLKVTETTTVDTKDLKSDADVTHSTLTTETNSVDFIPNSDNVVGVILFKHLRILVEQTLPTAFQFYFQLIHNKNNSLDLNDKSYLQVMRDFNLKPTCSVVRTEKFFTIDVPTSQADFYELEKEQQIYNRASLSNSVSLSTAPSTSHVAVKRIGNNTYTGQLRKELAPKEDSVGKIKVWKKETGTTEFSSGDALKPESSLKMKISEEQEALRKLKGKKVYSPEADDMKRTDRELKKAVMDRRSSRDRFDGKRSFDHSSRQDQIGRPLYRSSFQAARERRIIDSEGSRDFKKRHVDSYRPQSSKKRMVETEDGADMHQAVVLYKKQSESAVSSRQLERASSFPPDLIVYSSQQSNRHSHWDSSSSTLPALTSTRWDTSPELRPTAPTTPKNNTSSTLLKNLSPMQLLDLATAQPESEKKD